MHNVDKRKLKLLKILKRDKNTTIERLAEECGVASRTISTDLQYMKLIYPIKTYRGKHGGGVEYE